MKRFLLGILTIFASSIFTSCEGQTKLPNELPPNTQITYISEGGFVPSFFSVLISGNTLKVTDQPAEKERFAWEAKLNDDELKNLYRIFVENKFDSIKPDKDRGVADGYSRSIELKFDRARFYAVQGDGVNSTEIHAERFKNIENALENLVKKYRK